MKRVISWIVFIAAIVVAIWLVPGVFRLKPENYFACLFFLTIFAGGTPALFLWLPAMEEASEEGCALFVLAFVVVIIAVLAAAGATWLIH